MKALNNLKGKMTVTAQLVVSFDFTEDEANQFLAAMEGERPTVLAEILSTKSPNAESVGSYDATKFHEAIGAALVNHRERQLKQIAAESEAA